MANIGKLLSFTELRYCSKGPNISTANIQHYRKYIGQTQAF